MNRGASRRDEGAIILVFAFVLVFLMILVAFAVDLGQGRWSKRDGQQAVDLASLSAGYHLAGNGGGATPQNRPRDACEAAFNSVRTNVEGFSPSTSAATACQGFPVTNTLCNSGTGVVTTGLVAGGNYRLRISWPVDDSTIADGRLTGGAGTIDGARCERMRIQLDKTDQTRFARVIGINTVETTASAVVRGAPGLDTLGVAALLLLEREGCGALQASGQGRVIVKATTDGTTWRPGVIQGDSAGSTAFSASPLNCTTNPNADGYVIYGTQLPAASGGGPSIIAENTPSGGQGIIATYADSVGGRAACCFPGGLNVQPTSSGVTSRVPADNRFNPTTRPAVTNLHSAAYTAAVTNGAATTGTVITDCSPNAALTTITPNPGDDTITVNCPGSGPNNNNPGLRVQNNKTVVFQGATTVKFIGGIDVATGGSLEVRDATTVTLARPAVGATAQLKVAGTASFNSPRNLYIGGTPSSCTQTTANCWAVDASGTLRVNTGAISTSACPIGPGGNPGSTATNWTTMATVGGTVNVTGAVSWCQTVVYVGRSQPSYAPSQRVAGGLNCTLALPCPILSTAASRDRFSLSGGGSSITWSAPNQTTTPPDATNPFEGLALWVEGTGLSQIKGTGAVVTTGVFFLPNAGFQFDGQALATNPLNAQFFSRTLDFSGQGDLNLSPDPKDAVPTPVPGTYVVIR